MNKDPDANVNTDSHKFDEFLHFTLEPVRCLRDWEQTGVKRKNTGLARNQVAV